VRWVFYSLLILNLVYLVWSLVEWSAPAVQPVQQRNLETSAPRKLTLLEEARAGDAASAGGTEERTAAPQSRKRLCPVVGPWETGKQAREALQTLAGEGYRGRVRPVEVEKERLHWVYLPPFENRQEALDTLRELQSRGVDSFVVTEGADSNAISLGYFKNEDSAEGLQSKMQTAGYPAEIRETAQTVTEYWVYLDSRSIADDGEALRSFIADRENLEADHSSCEALERRGPSP
jgi:cell division septation protein DedD